MSGSDYVGLGRPFQQRHWSHTALRSPLQAVKISLPFLHSSDSPGPALRDGDCFAQGRILF